MTLLRRIWEKNYLQVVKKGDNSAVTALLQELLVNRFYLRLLVSVVTLILSWSKL